MTQNVGKSHLYGGEIEVRVRPLEGLTLFASVGLLKTKFDEAITFDQGALRNYRRKRVSRIAERDAASAGGIWKQPVRTLRQHGRVLHRRLFQPHVIWRTIRLRYVDAFTLVNAQLGYETKNGTLAIFALQSVRRAVFDLTNVATPG